MDTLKDATNSWLDQFKEVAQHFQLDAKVYGFEVKVKIEGPSSYPIRRLNDLLSKFEEKLPHFTFWHGRKIPVFIIDEANELRALLKDPHGHDAIHNFFKWLVLNTKEQRRFHVLLASSDSFFHIWISKLIGSTRYEAIVIGDLDKEHARAFWKQKVKQLEMNLALNVINCGLILYPLYPFWCFTRWNH